MFFPSAHILDKQLNKGRYLAHIFCTPVVSLKSALRALLKRLRRNKEYYSHLNDFSNVKLISSNIQDEIDRLNSIFTSRFSNCKPSQLWNNIRSLVLVPTKRNIPNVNVDALNKSFIHGPTDTHVLLPPPLLNPFVFKFATNSDTLPLLCRIKSNSTESSIGREWCTTGYTI